MKKMLQLTLASALIMAIAQPALSIDLKTEKHKIGYAIGLNMSNSLKTITDEIDIDALVTGLKDGVKNKKLQLTQEQVKTILMAFQDKMTKKQIAQQTAKKKSLEPKNLATGKKFLEENKKKKGVITTKSGLQYKIIKSGNGKVSPKLTDTVTTHYRGKLINGTEFDKSKQPTSFPVNGVIKGWIEALQLMKAGDKWELYVPSALAYGKPGKGPIGPNETLIFEIELIKIDS